MEEEEKIGEQRRCRAKNKGKKKEGNRKRDWRRNKKSIGSCKEQNKTIREREEKEEVGGGGRRWRRTSAKVENAEQES